MPKLDLGPVKGDKGDKGDKGIGIIDLQLKETTSDGSKVYEIILDNGHKLEFISPRGAVGATGSKGDKGDKGADGIGITNIRYKELASDGSFIYTITVTDGQTYDITSPIGPKGDKGDKGEKGDRGDVVSLDFSNIINNHKIFPKRIGSVTEVTDFNDLCESGIYYSNNWQGLYINGFLGAEQQGYGEFTLFNLGSTAISPALKTQLVIYRETKNIYIRSCTTWQEPWVWSEWERLPRMLDLDNYLPLTGGTVTGRTYFNNYVFTGFNSGIKFRTSKEDTTGKWLISNTNGNVIDIGSSESKEISVRVISNELNVLGLANSDNLNTRGNLKVEGNSSLSGVTTLNTLTVNKNINLSVDSYIVGDIKATENIVGNNAKEIRGFGKVYNPVWG